MFTCYKYADHDEYLGYSGVVVKLAVLVVWRCRQMVPKSSADSKKYI